MNELMAANISPEQSASVGRRQRPEISIIHQLYPQISSPHIVPSQLKRFMYHNLEGNELEGAEQNQGPSQSPKELVGCFMSAV